VEDHGVCGLGVQTFDIHLDAGGGGGRKRQRRDGGGEEEGAIHILVPELEVFRKPIARTLP
jgi:hypothetical protein